VTNDAEVILDDTADEFAQIPPELRRVLAVIGHEGGKCLLLLPEFAERAKVPTGMMRNALRVAEERGIIRVRGQGRKRPRPYAIEIISPPWLRYLTAHPHADGAGRLER
jgi:hypothetical protein